MIFYDFRWTTWRRAGKLQEESSFIIYLSGQQVDAEWFCAQNIHINHYLGHQLWQMAYNGCEGVITYEDWQVIGWIKQQFDYETETKNRMGIARQSFVKSGNIFWSTSLNLKLRCCLYGACWFGLCCCMKQNVDS